VKLRTSKPNGVALLEGEQARVTPEGPSAAVIVSRGFLPLRVRTEAGGVHHRPAFPGTAVFLEGRHYEVVGEELEDDRVLYRLEPWPSDSILRGTVAYGPEWLGPILEERRRAGLRARVRPYARFLYPLVGLLPEDAQLRSCDRLGLDPAMATFSSGIVEAVALVALARILVWRAPQAAAAVLFGFTPWLATAALRALGGLVFREVAGSLLFSVAARLGIGAAQVARRADAEIPPLTRDAFWARLAIPDRVRREADGSYLVRSTLAHLSWTPSGRVRFEDEWWLAEALPAAVAGGRLVFSYRLTALAAAGRGGAPPAPPDVTAYACEVWDQVGGDWRDLRRAGFGWLVSLAPREVQARATRDERGPASLRVAAVASALGEGLAAVWFALGPGAANAAFAIVLAGDGLNRLRLALAGGFAPSLFGPLFADYLRPERTAYHAHRDAERRALREAG
jgi:hypothetical protein